jgi:general secretion pathway protein L
MATRPGTERWRALGAAVLAIAYASLWITLGNRESAHAAWTERVQTAQREARDARKLRNALQDSVRAANFLAKQRASQPTVLEILTDLTRRLPDDTFLEKIQVNSGNVVLIGQSARASALVGVLQDSPLIHKPTLSGSVQADPRTGKERFTLTAVVAGSQAEKEGANGDASGD